MNQTFTGPRQALLKRIDYDTDRQAAVPYIGEYHLIQLPALIFLDGQEHLLWMAVGEVAKENVAAKLQLGLKPISGMIIGELMGSLQTKKLSQFGG